MAASGRLHWLMALFAGALPFLRWILGLVAGPLIGHFIRSRVLGGGTPPSGSEGPSTSTVATDEFANDARSRQRRPWTGTYSRGSFAGEASLRPRPRRSQDPARRTHLGRLPSTPRSLPGPAGFPGWADEATKRQAATVRPGDGTGTRRSPSSGCPPVLPRRRSSTRTDDSCRSCIPTGAAATISPRPSTWRNGSCWAIDEAPVGDGLAPSRFRGAVRRPGDRKGRPYGRPRQR